jgi:hypothetical protein
MSTGRRRGNSAVLSQAKDTRGQAITVRGQLGEERLAVESGESNRGSNGLRRGRPFAEVVGAARVGETLPDSSLCLPYLTYPRL